MCLLKMINIKVQGIRNIYCCAWELHRQYSDRTDWGEGSGKVRWERNLMKSWVYIVHVGNMKGKHLTLISKLGTW